MICDYGHPVRLTADKSGNGSKTTLYSVTYQDDTGRNYRLDTFSLDGVGAWIDDMYQNFPPRYHSDNRIQFTKQAVGS